MNRDEKRKQKARYKDERDAVKRGIRDVTRLLDWIFLVLIAIAAVLYVTFLRDTLDLF